MNNQNDDSLNFGHRLTDDEYQHRVVALYEGRPAMPTASEQRELRRLELNLMIDHRLGTGFPQDRREALWRVSENVERHRLRFGMTSLLSLLIPRFYGRHARGLAGLMFKEYKQVLSPSEFEQFFKP